MGRRSSHKPEDLKDLIIRTAMSLIESDGIRGLSARTIARQIGYSPGTLYNVFMNLDALIFHVEVRALDELITILMEAQTGSAPEDRLRNVAHAYLAFALKRPKLWSLLFEHHVALPADVPTAYVERLVLVQRVIEHAMRSDLRGDIDEGATVRTARLTFCALNGIAALATSAKMSKLSPETASLLVDELIERFSQPPSDAVSGWAQESATRV